MKRLIGMYKGHLVEIDRVERSWAMVHTLDGSQIFNKVYAGAGSGMESSGNVFLDKLEDVKEYDIPEGLIESDPFDPNDTAPEIEPEYDPYVEYVQMTNELRHGLA